MKDFKIEAMSIVNSLLKRGYPDKILLNAFNRAWNKTQSELLLPTLRATENKIRWITTFNQKNPPLKQIKKIHEGWLDKTKKDIKLKDLQTVYRKAKNLKQLLVKGKIHTLMQTSGFSTNCNKPCITCPRMDSSNTVTSRSNISYKIQGKFTCQTKNAVYVMECTICHKQYIGETSQTVNTRFRVHKSFIRMKKENNIADLFNMTNHTPTSYTIKIVGQEEDKNRRLRLEES